MCFTSKNYYKTGNFSCVLKQKDPDFLKRFSAILSLTLSQARYTPHKRNRKEISSERL